MSNPSPATEHWTDYWKVWRFADESDLTLVGNNWEYRPVVDLKQDKKITNTAENYKSSYSKLYSDFGGQANVDRAHELQFSTFNITLSKPDQPDAFGTVSVTKVTEESSKLWWGFSVQVNTPERPNWKSFYHLFFQTKGQISDAKDTFMNYHCAFKYPVKTIDENRMWPEIQTYTDCGMNDLSTTAISVALPS